MISKIILNKHVLSLYLPFYIFFNLVSFAHVSTIHSPRQFQIHNLYHWKRIISIIFWTSLHLQGNARWSSPLPLPQIVLPFVLLPTVLERACFFSLPLVLGLLFEVGLIAGETVCLAPHVITASGSCVAVTHDSHAFFPLKKKSWWMWGIKSSLISSSNFTILSVFYPYLFRSSSISLIWISNNSTEKSQQ